MHLTRLHGSPTCTVVQPTAAAIIHIVTVDHSTTATLLLLFLAETQNLNLVPTAATTACVARCSHADGGSDSKDKQSQQFSVSCDRNMMNSFI